MRIHFIGVGGIGVSALARYYLQKGRKISGSDLVSSEITEALKKEGVKIKIGVHKRGNLPRDTGLVIYSEAVPENNPEIKAAKSRKVKMLSGAEALGELTKNYFTIAVTGTHGKSTTTAMLALILIKAGLNPTVMLGTKLKEFGDSNFHLGGLPKIRYKIPRRKAFGFLRGRQDTRYKYLVIEADEYGAKFLNYRPKIIVLTNIDKDHLDYYKTFANVKKTYKKFIGLLPKNGVLVLNSKLKSQTSKPHLKTKNYSLKQVEAKKLKKILKVPGEHNVANALAALTAARVLKIPDKISFETLSEYRGSWRRFEIVKTAPYTIISDYAHHPAEISATLKAAREKYPHKKIWCVFQPHQYQRTYYLFGDFVKVFRKALVDKLIITDIYDVAGREKGKIRRKVNSKKLVKAIGSAVYLPYHRIIGYLKQNVQGGEVVIIMGAGDIYNLTPLEAHPNTR